MTNYLRILLLFLFITPLSCASILNPYDDKMQCPDTFKGKCSSMPNAYNESLMGVDSEVVAKLQSCKGDDCKKLSNQILASLKGTRDEAKRAFQERQYDKMTQLISEPEAPIVVPPEVVRILILSYTTDSNVNLGNRFGYFFATEPTFVFSTTNYSR